MKAPAFQGFLVWLERYTSLALHLARCPWRHSQSVEHSIKLTSMKHYPFTDNSLDLSLYRSKSWLTLKSGVSLGTASWKHWQFQDTLIGMTVTPTKLSRKGWQRKRVTCSTWTLHQPSHNVMSMKSQTKWSAQLKENGSWTWQLTQGYFGEVS